jgi:hypothetical protein
MATQFSDPAWWPKPPPQPPKPVSIRKIMFGTVVPIAAVVVGAIVVFTMHTNSASSTRSIAAFDACLKAHGASQGSSGRPTRDAARACQDKLPPGTRIGTFGTESSAQEQFDECLRSALAGIPRGDLRDPGGRQAYENAVQVCQTLIEGRGGSTTIGQTTTTTTPTAPPAV